ncbi:alpha/beta hydrolase [Ornithinibacillus halotolerans]|uniref:AB hydrolase-1 domain-containing protein n=1 Tax=Ornithinibacillus halotolerans TaxID=1274357 RepID=A0A916WCK5_9BACI|nr:alpha/beta hydrolase [Ornithinibacillus halotolerans]GGA85664.1 hypothetical protein GCM10008025_30810 [Ornithinibacillus halotolerans]
MKNYHSIIIGKGEPLIFHPAAGFSGMEGLNIAENLADHYECHLLDLPGMGKSKGIDGRVTIHKISAWLKDYIELHKMKKVTLVGHSMGAGVAMCFASTYPHQVNKIILLDQGHKNIPRFPTRDFGVFGYVVPIFSLLERTFGDVFIKRIEKLFIGTPKEVTSEDIEKRVVDFCTRFQIDRSEYIDKAFREDAPFTREGLRFMFGYFRMNLPKLLNNITAPCLLIYASFEGFDQKEANRTKKAVAKLRQTKNIEMFQIKGQHYVHWGNNNCLDKINQFLAVEKKSSHSQKKKASSV